MVFGLLEVPLRLTGLLCSPPFLLLRAVGLLTFALSAFPVGLQSYLDGVVHDVLRQGLRGLRIQAIRCVYDGVVQGLSLPRRRIRRAAMVALLIRSGADPEGNPGADWTPLHWAAYTGEAPIVTQILDAGAKANPQEHSGLTPMHIAAIDGHKEAVVTLLAHGADPTIRNNQGKTALDLALLNGRHEVAEILRKHGTR